MAESIPISTINTTFRSKVVLRPQLSTTTTPTTSHSPSKKVLVMVEFHKTFRVIPPHSHSTTTEEEDAKALLPPRYELVSRYPKGVLVLDHRDLFEADDITKSLGLSCEFEQFLTGHIAMSPESLNGFKKRIRKQLFHAWRQSTKKTDQDNGASSVLVLEINVDSTEQFHSYAAWGVSPLPSRWAKQQQEEEEVRCPICFEKMDKHSSDCLTLPRCGHTFHAGCAEQWADHSYPARPTCPLCRLSIF